MIYRQKGGRHPKISRQVELSQDKSHFERKQQSGGLSTKQVEEQIIQESGNKVSP
ncbi:hypothetical protein BH23THE1_BH23THE1_15270 [soil metagenome]